MVCFNTYFCLSSRHVKVSWSALTPFRLITTGMDGLSRIWDVREAALKRYGSQVGSREEYTLTLTETEKQVAESAETLSSGEGSNDETENANLPPIPMRLDEIESGQPSAAEDLAAAVALPQGAPAAAVNNAEGAAALNQNINPGAFVFNDVLDEGVKIIAKHAHGEIQQQETAGPGTRSKRKTVKVLCVARCPNAGHFATGSDDGLCKIWYDDEESRVQVVDQRKCPGFDIFDKRRGSSKRLSVNDTASTWINFTFKSCFDFFTFSSQPLSQCLRNPILSVLFTATWHR